MSVRVQMNAVEQYYGVGGWCEISCLLRLSFKNESIHERDEKRGHSSTLFKARLKSLIAEQTRDKTHTNKYGSLSLAPNVECV
eukprot:scaffold1583_cov123-Skeletonema_dohrnii-CCMP3373.AAC.7